MKTARFLVSAVLRSLNSALVTKGYALCHRRRRLRRSGGSAPGPPPCRGLSLAPSSPSCTATRKPIDLGEAFWRHPTLHLGRSQRPLPQALRGLNDEVGTRT